ncbi:hypothetical protein RIF29_10644 [Crotalaria pallida]|uniref:Uncharacterized protein n=1 Tax=Crotalaria pallida TaxID=3830 RepID=A0AAN9FZ62_CROPI
MVVEVDPLSHPFLLLLMFKIHHIVLNLYILNLNLQVLPPLFSQSSTSNQLGDGGQSSVIPTTEPQGSDPPVVPSSVDSRTDRTARRNVLYVEPADDPKRFNDSKVNRDIISTVIMRMPNPAPVWKRYSEHMATTFLNNFMIIKFLIGVSSSGWNKIKLLTCGKELIALLNEYRILISDVEK